MQTCVLKCLNDPGKNLSKLKAELDEFKPVGFPINEYQSINIKFGSKLH